jgi:hypothetical protein
MKSIAAVPRVFAFAFGFVSFALAGSAWAQSTGGAGLVKQQAGVLQVGEITIVGRVQKPIAAVDVATVQPKLTLAELRQPFLDRIEAAITKDPF